MSKKYFLMGNAHLDPVWQWCFPEGLSLIKSTFKAALDRMDEYPNYIFTSACAGYYDWIKKSEPEMFEKIKRRIEEGRWQYTGGMWVQPDCNIPSGEAFARHFLYSQRFYTENFGAGAQTGYNVDSFGHNGMLPQLFSKAGIKNYVYMRPNDDNEKPNLPKFSLHWWESPDGSRVLAFRILDGGYCGGMEEHRFTRYREQPNSQLFPYGVGNHGGGPTIEALNEAEKLCEIKGDEEYLYSGVDQYFDYMRNVEGVDDIPIIKEDLQHHASGCYSANSEIKLLNRQTENELVYSEKMDIMASALTDSDIHTKAFEEAWKRVMFNQFHDILAGCSIKPAYDDAKAAFGYAKEMGLEIGTFAAERISWRVNTQKFFDKKSTSEQRDRLWVKEGEGSPMVIFNPHSFPYKGLIDFGCQWVSGVVDSDDNDVPFQIVRATYTDGWSKKKCLFEVDIPAFGYATYYIFKDEQNYPAKERENQFTVTENSIENSVVKLTFNADGEVASYFNKLENKEYCSAPIGAVICEDEPNDTWGHNVFDYNDDIGKFGSAKLEVLETGHLRAVMKVTSYYKENSTLELYYTLLKDSPKVEVKCRINLREKHKIAKLTFPMATENPRAIYSMPFGFIEKPTDGLEEPAQKWISNGNMALINNGRYSFCVKGNEMRMIAARTCICLDHYGQKSRDGENVYLDMNELEFTYELLPHEDGNYIEVQKEAELLNMPVRLYQETHHKGELPPVYNGIKVDCDNVLVTSIKLAEDGSGYILRAIETAGKAVMAEIDIKLLDRKFAFDFKPQEVKTIFIPLKGGNVKGVMLTEK